MDANLKRLIEDYKMKKIVPFIGAGLSVPFNVPTWKSLIQNIADEYAVEDKIFVKDAINLYLERYDYWEAVKQLKNMCNLNEQDIQSKVASLIKERMVYDSEAIDHSYKDLDEMNFNLFLTTNYDGLLYKFVRCDSYPLSLQDIEFNTQSLFDERRIFNLHGDIHNYGKIVLSYESYQELYESRKYSNLFNLIAGSSKFLFMGFSFNDQFIQKLIEDHHDFFKSEHYILLDNPSETKIKELKDKYNLTTIKYDSEKSSHEKEIRKIFTSLLNEYNHNELIQEQSSQEVSQTLDEIVGAQITDLDKDVENNLFFKKLQLENVEPDLIELSSIFYIAAEVYIRELKKSGIQIEVINRMLFKVFTTYKREYVQTYKKFGNSQQFVEKVHDTLREIDFGRIASYFKSGLVSEEDEKQGLIHLLADKNEKEIWWGEKRFESK